MTPLTREQVARIAKAAAKRYKRRRIEGIQSRAYRVHLVGKKVEFEALDEGREEQP